MCDLYVILISLTSIAARLSFLDRGEGYLRTELGVRVGLIVEVIPADQEAT